jgi:type IV pilus assembly protein PilW
MRRARLPGAAGFSLVELLISLAIGLAMIVFVTDLFLRSKGSYDLHDEYGRLQQEARLAMALIGRNLSQAGFGRPLGIGAQLQTSFTGRAFFACDSGFRQPEQAGPGDCAGSGSAASAFEVSYVVDGTVNSNTGAGTDCNGQAVPRNAEGERIVINRFYLKPVEGAGRALYCTGNGNPIGQPVLGNVEAMQLTYGVSEAHSARPNRFLGRADAVLAGERDTGAANGANGANEANSAFGSVVSVALCLQTVSSHTVPAAPQSFVDCQGRRQMASDRKIHSVLHGVFALRNRLDSTVLAYPGRP